MRNAREIDVDCIADFIGEVAKSRSKNDRDSSRAQRRQARLRIARQELPGHGNRRGSSPARDG